MCQSAKFMDIEIRKRSLVRQRLLMLGCWTPCNSTHLTGEGMIRETNVEPLNHCK
jgi:hypothetical protein